MDVLRGELPFDSRRVQLLVKDFNPRGMEKIIAWLLNEEADLFQGGDAVFFVAAHPDEVHAES